MGLSLVGEDFDPTSGETSSSFEYYRLSKYSCILSITIWRVYLGRPQQLEQERKTVQETSYAILALNQIDPN